MIKSMKAYEKAVPWRAAYALAFALPVAIMLVLFVIRGIYPFGDRSFLFSDMYHQYMPFFSEFMRKVKAGEGLSWSYNVGIGSNFLALYVYYLASPLHWFAFLVPESHLMEFMSYLVVIKIGLMGLSAFYYMQKSYRVRDDSALFFSCFYALSGFVAAYNWNIMWLDCVILLPLILLGLELLVKEGRVTLYLVTLSLSILTNYYISIMICIFLVFYFVYLFFTEHKSLKIVGNFVLYSLLAGGIAALLLVPEVCAILETDFGDMDFPKKVESYFPILQILARHGMCVFTHRGLDHWPNIYCGCAVMMLIPMYMMNQEIPIRRRFGKMVLAGALLLAFNTNMLDFIWHGLNYPDSLPARQSFIYIFLVITMCYEAWRELEKADKKQILYGYLAAVGFLLFCEQFIDSKDFEPGVEMLNIAFVTIYAVLLYLYRTRTDCDWRKMLGIVALVTIIAELGINTYDTSIGTTSRSAYLGQQADYRGLYELTRQREEGFYRLEKFTRKTKNDSTLTGYPTASLFSSTMNSYVMDMYDRLGMRHSKVYYGFDGATAFTAALLNVNYMFGESADYENSLYGMLCQSGDIYLYESRARLPFGYVAPLGWDLSEKYEDNGIAQQNYMVRELGMEGGLFNRVSSDTSDGKVHVTAKEDGIYYAQLSAGGTNEVEAAGGVPDTMKFNDLKKGSILYLGYLKEGDRMTLSNCDEDDTAKTVRADVYVMNEEVLQEALDKLSAQCMEPVQYDSTSMEGRISLQEAGRVILSIPYEKGWRVLVNGEEVTPALFGGALMAFDLQPGEYVFELDYVPEGKYAGIMISAISVLAAAAVLTGRRRARHSN